MPYVYPYAYIVAPVMVAFLVAGVALFKGFPNVRKYAFAFLSLAGLFEVSIFGIYNDGAVIG